MLSSSSKEGEPPKTSGKSPGAFSSRAPPDSTSSKKSLSHHGKHFPRVKEWPDKHDKESHSTSSKHKDKSHSDKSSKHNYDKEANRSLHKHHMSLPPQPSSSERAGKECCLEDTTQTSSTDMCTHPQSPSKCMSETEDQSSFTTPSSTSIPNKIGSGLCYQSHSNSTDSRHSMTPLDTLLYGSFSYPGPAGMGHGSITPVTSIARSQQVTSSMWHPPRPFSPTLPPAMDTLSAEQVVEIYQLATKYQALGTELAKQF